MPVASGSKNQPTRAFRSALSNKSPDPDSAVAARVDTSTDAITQYPDIVNAKGSKADALLMQAQQLIEEKFGVVNFHPVTYMLAVAADESQDLNKRMAAARAAAPYVAPTLKGIEVSGDPDKPLAVDISDSRERFARLAGIVMTQEEDV